MINLKVEIAILTKLPSLTQRAIRKLERAGIRVVSIERSGNRAMVYGTLSVRSTVPPTAKPSSVWDTMVPWSENRTPYPR